MPFHSKNVTPSSGYPFVYQRTGLANVAARPKQLLGCIAVYSMHRPVGTTVWNPMALWGYKTESPYWDVSLGADVVNGPLTYNAGGAVLDSGSSQYLNCNGVFFNSWPFTICVWFKTDNASASYRCILQIGDDTSTQRYIGIQMANTHEVFTSAKNQGDTGSAQTTETWNDGLWHQLVGVYRSDTYRATYVDGIFRAEDTTDIGGFPSSLDTTFIGCYNNSGSYVNYWPGSIGEVRLYRRELTPNEILEMYRNPWAIYEYPAWQPQAIESAGGSSVVIRRQYQHHLG